MHFMQPLFRRFAFYRTLLKENILYFRRCHYATRQVIPQVALVSLTPPQVRATAMLESPTVGEYKYQLHLSPEHTMSIPNFIKIPP